MSCELKICIKRLVGGGISNDQKLIPALQSEFGFYIIIPRKQFYFKVAIIQQRSEFEINSLEMTSTHTPLFLLTYCLEQQILSVSYKLLSDTGLNLF